MHRFADACITPKPTDAKVVRFVETLGEVVNALEPRERLWALAAQSSSRANLAG